MDAGVIILLVVVFIGGWVLGHITARARAKRDLPASPPGAAIQPPRDVGLEIHDEERQAIGAKIAEGRTIEAIKLYREATGVGLADAKHAVDRWAAFGEPTDENQWRALPPDNQL